MRGITAVVVFLLFVILLGRAFDQEFASAGGRLSERDHRGDGKSSAGVAHSAPAHRRPVNAFNASVANPSARSESLYQGKPILWWAKRAVQARRDANARARTIRRLRAELRRQYEPSFEHYFTIASLTYRVDRAMLERRGRCESVNFTDFYNETPIYNGEHAQGVMGFIPSTFNSTPYRGLDVRYDHLANIMAGAWMHANGRGGEWACR